MNEPCTIAFPGPGAMGGPMAGHLARAGRHVTACNRSPARLAKWREIWAAEGLAVRFAETPAQAAGLDLAKTCEAIPGGAAQSWQMDNRRATMTQGQFDFGFAIDRMRKDTCALVTRLPRRIPEER